MTPSCQIVGEMDSADSLALDLVNTGRGDVQKEVDKVIIEQIHLIYIKKSSMCPGEQPGFK